MPVLLKTLYLDGILFFLFIIGSSYINLFFISMSSVNVRMKPVISISKSHIHSLN
ncbi:hypothetical protein HETIRDRAFT_327368 [Heterobasidion irregulare TC 32-1]|uniref:Uncharacterized protein n=1 Tax=Heterobasidion irregulare (strain TC 32-1) TaxID=747525 RepID=W4JXC7_HETIT|nr:uncharacterized protein HETIRDRAFT_327368 [Heterobasidion irregulare TC 32-1]ETW77541.1 hypothetical protein HETIRDRAFT_327368 [Heterobasidion irregulare TC 32-1]